MTERFINWRLEQRDGKAAKVPFDPATRKTINPLEPANWKSKAEAQATGHFIGEVLTADEPYAVIDIDNCYDPETQEWDARAQRAFQLFQGCPWKLSQSERGVHIKVRVDKAVTAALRNRADGFEFYDRKRFIAQGEHEWRPGDLDTDHTGAVCLLMGYTQLPQGMPMAPSGRDPAWKGPDDDEELLQRALNSRASVTAQWGEGITFRQLWEGDTAALQATYGDEQGGWDQSAAELALFNHLAFWTGRDQARIIRMYQMSPLAQHQDERKRNRHDYLNRTAAKAANSASGVYRDPKAVADSSELGDYLSVEETRGRFQGCIYVADQNAILTPSGVFMNQERFRAWMGGKRFSISWDNGTSTDNAWKAFTENRAIEFPKALTTCVDPKTSFGTIKDAAVNVYRPPQISPRHGDVGPFLNWLRVFLPEEQDREILLSWMAALAQYPGEKFRWAPVLQGTKGNGKTMVVEIMRHFVGRDWSFTVDPTKLEGRFNGYLQDKLLLSVDEIHMENRRSILDRLKPLITDSRISIEGKGVEQREIDNLANWIFTTNYKNAILKERDDRRFAVFFTGQQSSADLERDGMAGDYFPKMHRWLVNGGYDFITHYLQNRPIDSKFNPAVQHGGLADRAPETSSTAAAVAESASVLEQELRERIEGEVQGFRGGWISCNAIEVMKKELGLRHGRTHQSNILSQMGYENAGRATRMIAEENHKKPVLWALPHVTDRTTEAYMRAQNYLVDEPPASVPRMPFK